MDVHTRRALLRTQVGPAAALDYVISLREAVPMGGGRPGHALTVRYVPDRLVLDPASLAPFLAALAERTAGALEPLAVAILEDLRNELVPRWLQVVLTMGEAGDGAHPRHAVLLEDRQPKWDNPSLLTRLAVL